MPVRIWRRGRTALVAVVLTAFLPPPAPAAELEEELARLRDEIDRLRDENADVRRQLAETVRVVRDVEAQHAARRARGDGEPPPAVGAGAVPVPRLVDISFSSNVAAGFSSERDAEIQRLQFGDHDPRQRGFTLQQAELSLIGAVDSYLRGEAHLLFLLDTEGESSVEIEEMMLITQALPAGLQLELGQFLTEFGRLNPRHPHAWQWQDQPLILSRLFGADGMRAPGVRLAWLTPLPWFSELHVGAQNARGEAMASFLASEEVFDETPVGGRPFRERDVGGLDELVWLVRWANGWDFSDEVATALGLSALFGPNATGPHARTQILGADWVLKWSPSDQRRGWPFALLESEVAYRNYEADAADGLPADTLRDWGFYVQGLWGFRPRWAAGLRVEYATGSGASVGGRAQDFLRDDRLRLAPLLAFHPSEYSRIRLQYNFDEADHLERRDRAHSLWLGFEIGLGAHPAHAF